MNKQTEALKLALEDLLLVWKDRLSTHPPQPAPVQQEPVAWMWVIDGKPHNVTFGGANSNTPKDWTVLPLYTSPPASKPWVGLTEYEMDELWYSHLYKDLMIAIEAKLKEKNT